MVGRSIDSVLFPVLEYWIENCIDCLGFKVATPIYSLAIDSDGLLRAFIQRVCLAELEPIDPFFP